MLKKLKKCKTFGEIYSTVGESGFAQGAKWLIIMLIVSPIVAGVINYVMLLQIKYYYDAYEYNYKFMAVTNMIFSAITVFVCVYLIGKIRHNKWYIEDAIKKIKVKEPWLLFWLALLVWGFITSLASINISGAFMGATELSSGYISHIYTVCVMVCASLISTTDRKKVINIYIVVSDILAVIMLAFQYDIPFFSGFTAATGCSVFTNSNHYGYYLAVSSLCMAGMYFLNKEDEKNNRKAAVAYMLSFIIQIWALMINDTLGAYLGVVFGLISLMIMWKIRVGKVGIYFWIPMVIVVIETLMSFMGIITSKLGSTIGPSLVIFLQDIFKVAEKQEGYKQAGTNRIQLWLDTINAVLRRPILGYGPDVMYDRYYQICVSMTPHNEYLECALFMGIPGGMLYLAGLISLFICRVKEIKKLPLPMFMAAGAVIAYLVSAFFGVRKYHTVLYLYVFIGFLIKSHSKE